MMDMMKYSFFSAPAAARHRAELEGMREVRKPRHNKVLAP